jgi:alanine racemase
MNKERVYAQIDLEAVRFNLESMHKNINPTAKMAAVIKADAYGHGALRVAEAIEDLPYLWGFAVATVDEALALIEGGRKKPILILGISFPEQYEDIVEQDIRPAVCTYEAAQALSAIAVAKGKTCHIHIKIDTGMSRIGFLVEEQSAQTIAEIAALPNLCIEGIFTHLAQADETDKTAAMAQISLFRRMIRMTEELGVKIPIHHCSNSAGIVEIPDANMDMVRAGITLYGLWPSEEVSREILPLHPVMSLKSRVSFVKELPKGRRISYGGTYVTPSVRCIATIPVGYADGYARGLSNKGYVLIHGQKAPICGRVCMDQFMVDVTDIPDVAAGDVVTLLGRDGNESITMEELGTLSGRFNYEFACLITQRVPRIYIRSDL